MDAASHTRRPTVGTPGLEQRLDGETERRLTAILGRDGLITHPERLTPYETDALTYLKGRPSAVLLPSDRTRLVEAVAVLSSAGIPYVPRGSGTGICGGATGEGAVVVSAARLRDIEIDAVGRTARVDAGVITAQISRAAAASGLRYLPDPSSATACSIGGNIAQNSGGPHCLKHGVTADHVRWVEVIRPDGPLVVGRGEDGGLDLAALFIGSEGTLGLVSRAGLRLEPEAPDVRTALALFDGMERAGRAVSAILEQATPVALEMMDRASIELVETSRFAAGLPRDTGALLVIEVEGDSEEVEDDIRHVASVAGEAGASEVRIASDARDRARLWAARKNGYGAMGQASPELLVQDAVVPRTRLPEVLTRIEAIAREHQVRLVNFFHAGDGNLHPNLLFDPAVPDEVERVHRASHEILHACVAAGGTITGEHGVGLDKRDAMQLVFGPAELERLHDLRDAVSPAGLTNPGKLLPDRSTGPGASSAGDDLASRDAREPSANPGIRPRDPADLTVTASADVSLDDLTAHLAADQQWLPPARFLNGGSVGDLVLHAPTSVYEPGFGDVARHVLSVLTRARDGCELRWGRAVFKDVAGYDVKRLWCGSRGGLGELLEVSLRVWPLPETVRWVRISGENALREWCTIGAADDPRPDAVLWRDELHLGFAGRETSVGVRAGRAARWALRIGLSADPAAEPPSSAGAPHLADTAIRLTPGRASLPDVVARLAAPGGQLDAFPHSGRVEVALPAGSDHDAWADAVLGAAGDHPARLLTGPDGLRQRLDARRDPRTVELETRVVNALAGRRPEPVPDRPRNGAHSRRSGR